VASNYLANITDGYGITPPITVSLATQASAFVDAYLRRPEGLLYNTDANGNPCSMVSATPELIFTLSGSISPGTNVVATVTPALIKSDTVGEVFVLDNSSSTLREACLVVSTIGNNQVVLGSVQFSHSSGALVQTGLLVTEERNCPSKRSIIRTAKGPIVNVLSLLGRYAYGRRSDQVGGLYQEMNLLAAVQTFGGPPQWIPIPLAQCSWSNATSEIWIPAGLLMAYYSDVRVRYVAGYVNPPDPIVSATISIASAISQSGGALAGQIKTLAAGNSKIERFGASFMDDETRAVLDPYKAKTMF
jgi:hypothetical protein